jgi:hypothetical protein
MKKQTLVAGLLAACLAAAPWAAADPDNPGLIGPVPGLVQNAVRGAPCSNYDRYIFGKTATDQWLACRPVPGGGGRWNASISVIGVRQLGALCGLAPSVNVAAQSPDGQPLFCDNGGTRRWVLGGG